MAQIVQKDAVGASSRHKRGLVLSYACIEVLGETGLEKG